MEELTVEQKFARASNGLPTAGRLFKVKGLVFGVGAPHGITLGVADEEMARVGAMEPD